MLSSKMKRLVLSLSVAVMTVFVAVAAMPGEIHVPQDYPTIQAAIDHAGPGDSIIVGPGTYTESPVIPSSLSGITLTCQKDAVIKGQVDVLASNITIEGCTITGSGNGIHLVNASNVTLQDNHISGNEFNGILVEGTYDSLTIIGNTICGNGQDGISLKGSGHQIVIANNQICDNNGYGLRISGGVTGVLVEKNTFSGNAEGSIHPE